MTDKQGIIFILLSQLIWGVTPVIIKSVPLTLPTSLLIATRYVLGGIILLVFILLNKRSVAGLKKLTKRQVLEIIMLGIVGSGLADLFAVHAIREIGVIIAVMIVRLEIPLGVLFAALILKEKITPRIILATVVSLWGVFLISYHPGLMIDIHNGFFMGIVSAFVASILWAFAGVYAKKVLSDNVSPTFLAAGRMSVGGIFSFAFAYYTLGQITPYFVNLKMETWLSLLFLTVVSSVAAFVLYYKGLERSKHQEPRFF